MKFRGHETFPIRKGWLNKGLRNVVRTPDVFISKTENPMDSLGIGANMVKALRYWLQAAGITQEPKKGRRIQQLTELGRIIYKKDPYFEEIGTLWLVHFVLATNLEDATAWYIFFNEFDMTEFSEEDFEKSVKKYLSMNATDLDMPSSRAITDDYKCILNTYWSRRRSMIDEAEVDPEDNMICPLTELGLIDFVMVRQGERIYRKNSPRTEMIPELIILAAILKRYEGAEEIRISALQNDRNSIGRVFCLDTVSLHALLYRLDQSGYLRVVRTAGLDVVKLTANMTYTECVERYYQELDEK